MATYPRFSRDLSPIARFSDIRRTRAATAARPSTQWQSSPTYRAGSTPTSAGKAPPSAATRSATGRTYRCEWYRQLFYAFIALKIRGQLGAVAHEDFKRRVINGPSTSAVEDCTTMDET